MVSPTEATGHESNLTDQTISQPPTPPPETHTPSPHTPISSTTPSLPATDHTAHVDNPPSITPTTNTSGESNTSSNYAPPKTQASTSVPTSGAPELETTTNTTTINQSNTTSNASSSQQPTKSSVSPTSVQNTLQPEGHPETSSETHQRPTTLRPSSPSAQAKAHADTPSQLNVGGDSKCIISSVFVYRNLLWIIHCLGY